jgi:hypothetical protein
MSLKYLLGADTKKERDRLLHLPLTKRMLNHHVMTLPLMVQLKPLLSFGCIGEGHCFFVTLSATSLKF